MKSLFSLVACGALALSACKGSSGPDWSGKELKPTEATVAGLAFTVALPDGMKKSDALSSETSVAWVPAEAGSPASPSISVAKLALPPATLKDATSRTGGDMVIAKQESIDGGFLVTSHNGEKSVVKVDVYKTVEGGALWCNAMQSRDGGLPKADETKAWLEKVCLSIDAKAAAKGDANARNDKSGDKPAVGAEIAPEMKDFLSGLVGSSTKVTESLKKHGAPDLDSKDMGLYDLTAPRVLKTELHGAKTCYTVEAKAGETVRSYLVCWDGGKIASVEDMGMK